MEELSKIIDTVSVMARVNAIYYEELIKMGFSEDLALELVARTGINLMEMLDSEGG